MGGHVRELLEVGVRALELRLRLLERPLGGPPLRDVKAVFDDPGHLSVVVEDGVGVDLDVAGIAVLVAVDVLDDGGPLRLGDQLQGAGVLVAAAGLGGDLRDAKLQGGQV